MVADKPLQPRQDAHQAAPGFPGRAKEGSRVPGTVKLQQGDPARDQDPLRRQVPDDLVPAMDGPQEGAGLLAVRHPGVPGGEAVPEIGIEAQRPQPLGQVEARSKGEGAVAQGVGAQARRIEAVMVAGGKGHPQEGADGRQPGGLRHQLIFEGAEQVSQAAETGGAGGQTRALHAAGPIVQEGRGQINFQVGAQTVSNLYGDFQGGKISPGAHPAPVGGEIAPHQTQAAKRLHGQFAGGGGHGGIRHHGPHGEARLPGNRGGLRTAGRGRANPEAHQDDSQESRIEQG